MQKILVIDDDLSTIELVEGIFRKTSYQLLTAMSGEEGIEMAVRHVPDLILLDIVMPGLDGFDVMRGIKEKNLKSSVIFLTSSDDKEDIIKAFRLGAADYIKKPFILQEFKQRVKSRMELKKSREELMKSEEKFRTYTEKAPLAIIVANSRGDFIEVNQAAIHLTGYSEEELLTLNIQDLIAPEFMQKGLSMFEKVEVEGYVEGDFLAKKRHSYRFWANIVSVKIDENRVFGFLKDITKAKDAEERLKINEERYRSLVDQSMEMLFLHDMEGNFFEVNKAAILSTGYSKDELLRMNVFDILHPDMSRGHLLQQWRSWVVGESIILETMHRHKDGSYIPVQVRTGKVLIGDMEYILAFISDITDRKKAEEKILKYTKELELKSQETELLYYQMDKEMNKAKIVHERTLPGIIPDIEDIKFSTYYKPAKKLGGDFYNIIKEGDKVILYISDVTGHGMEASLLATFMREAIDSYISLKPDDIYPDKIIKHLNRQFARENYPAEYFICIFLVVIDLKTKEMLFCNAGIHEAPLINMDKLSFGGFPISTTIPADLYSFTNQTITLKDGDTLLFTTDGLTEQSMGEDVFSKILEETFYNNNYLPADIINRLINKEFAKFNKSLQGEDDITFIVMKIGKDKKEMNFVLDSNFEEFNKLRSKVKEELCECFEVCKSVLHEMVANAIEHGNKFAESKKIKIKVELEEDYIILTVEDEGDGFDWVNKINKEIDLQGISDRGRGISLSELLVEHVLYNPKGNSCAVVVKR